MLNSKKTTVYIGKDRLWAGKIVFKYGGGVLTPYFKKIAKKLGVKRVSIVLGESKSYPIVLAVPSIDNLQDIVYQVSSMIPEKITESSFKWKSLGSETKEGYKWIEALVIPEGVLANIGSSSKEAKIEINGIHPISQLLVSDSADSKSPTIILWFGLEKTYAVTHKGVVYGSGIITKESTEMIKTITDSMNNDYGLKIKRVLTNLKQLKDKFKPPKGWSVDIVNLKPFENFKKSEHEFSLKPDYDLIAAEEAHIGLDSMKDIDSDDVDLENPKPSKKVVIGFLLVVIIMAAALVYFFLFRKSEISSEDTVLTETIEEVKEEELESEPEVESDLDLTDYLVQVQNGSGTSGVALEIADLLEESGFVGVETGNADNFEYQNLTIQMKEDLPDELFERLKEALEEDHQIIRSENFVSEGESYDIVVIIGSF